MAQLVARAASEHRAPHAMRQPSWSAAENRPCVVNVLRCGRRRRAIFLAHGSRFTSCRRRAQQRSLCEDGALRVPLFADVPVLLAPASRQASRTRLLRSLRAARRAVALRQKGLSRTTTAALLARLRPNGRAGCDTSTRLSEANSTGTICPMYAWAAVRYVSRTRGGSAAHARRAQSHVCAT